MRYACRPGHADDDGRWNQWRFGVFVTDATPVLINITPCNGTLEHSLPQQLVAVVMFTDKTTETVTAYARWTTSNPASRCSGARRPGVLNRCWSCNRDRKHWRNPGDR